MPPRPQYLTDDVPAMLPFAGAALEALAQRVGARQHIVAVEQIKHGKRSCAGQRIAGKRSAEAARAGSVHDFGAACNGGKQAVRRRETSPSQSGRARCRNCSLAKSVPVRSKAGLHFIGDKENAVLVTKVKQNLEVIGGRGDESSLSHHGLGNHGRNFFVGDNPLDMCPRGGARNRDRTTGISGCKSKR